MKTGEGKTLVSTLPAYLNGLSGKGMHLVTVNDYLATRDREWMGRLHNWLGLTTGLIVPGNHDPAFKRAQYAADITYGTNNEFGFDYLRDNMATSRPPGAAGPRLRHRRRGRLHPHRRGPHAAHHLGPARRRRQLYYKFASIVPQPERDDDYEVDEEKRTGRPHRGGHREGRAPARHRQPLRRRGPEPGPPAPGRPQGQGAVQARQGVRGHQRRGEDRRRVHGAHPRGPALVRRACTRRSRPRRASASRKRTRRSPRSRCRTTSACTTSSPA